MHASLTEPWRFFSLAFHTAWNNWLTYFYYFRRIPPFWLELPWQIFDIVIFQKDFWSSNGPSFHFQANQQQTAIVFCHVNIFIEFERQEFVSEIDFFPFLFLKSMFKKNSIEFTSWGTRWSKYVEGIPFAVTQRYHEWPKRVFADKPYRSVKLQ